MVAHDLGGQAHLLRGGAGTDCRTGAKAPVGRFAPSPTGRMHAGNVFAALMAWLIAKRDGGSIVLRIEDLDEQRSKSAFASAIMRDFEYLGLDWDRGPYYQSDRKNAYEEAYRDLESRGLLYPCFCTRADLHAASAPHRGEKAVYPGTCRSLTADERIARAKTRDPAMRLTVPAEVYGLNDAIQGTYRQNLADECGDFLVRRSDGAFAYQLAVVLDDADQGVTTVVRGCDLLCSTPQQLYLQDLFGFEHPAYAHIPLIAGEPNRRLSKRDRDADMEALRARFKTPEALIGHLAGITGIADTCDAIALDELLQRFSLEALRGTIQIQWR
ncbi:tRNA glutamyl-Q(34) synthetase GluQRS [Raoultibacter timonensis]|uniref:tRNA glutamyl-Q(34) synthetase GluQRS n=1 Tax=Raoultibacter timonensis TaxID=1907662 RepID=UPI000C84F1B8|nr:tRNA glutamyl-Q(34) synthetase GluQRS [Raoultibacter timonensis]